MINLLLENSMLLLFVVMAVGYLVGQIRIFGMQLGVSAVLFVGLFVGSLDAGLEIPALVPQLGLVIFLYAIGLSNGASFFRAFGSGSNREIGFIIFFLLIPVIAVTVLFFVTSLDVAAIAGLYAGMATNTAALASVIDVINSSTPAAAASSVVAIVVLGYSLSYPIGVVGRMLAISLMEKWLRIDYTREAHELRDDYPIARQLVTRSILVTNADMIGVPLRQLQREHRWDVLFGRIQHDGVTTLSSGETHLQLGDIVAIAAEDENADKVVADLGEDAAVDIVKDQSVYVRRRLFVSNPEVVGQHLAALDLKDRYGAVVTRVRRGDTDLLARSDTILELGDRVRVIARRRDMDALIELFGDSYEAVSRVNLLSFGVGITAGLLLGMVTVQFPGGVSFQLGFAGGPLIVALILGAIRRTGSLVWTLPYSVNETLQQIGLLLLLAGIGIRSGNTLLSSFNAAIGVQLISYAILIVFLGSCLVLFVGHRLVKIPFSIAAGMVASQPAVLRFVTDRTNNQLPQIGFAMALPIGVILKVASAQLLFIVLSRF